MQLHVAICDDEPDVIIKYEELLESITRKNGIDTVFDGYKSGDQLLFYVDDVIRNEDIIFMDINMPGTNGIDTARRLREKGFEGEMIFLTSTTDGVFHAFDVRATNYLVKETFTNQRMEEVFMRAAKTAMDKKSEYILLTGVGEYRNISVSDIRYFEVTQKIVTVYYGDETFEFVSSIGKLENLLFSKGFLRIAKSFLVNKDYIGSFSYEQVTLTTGESLPVGRKYYKGLKEAMRGGLDEQ